MSINTKKVNQIENEVADGKISKAISRLEGLIFANPNEAIYREMLGNIYFSVKWFEKAGQYWFLTNRDSADKLIAIQVFEKSHGNSATQILSVLKFRGETSKLPLDLVEIYKELESESLRTNGFIPKFTISKTGKKIEQTKDSKSDNIYKIGCFLTGIILLLLIILGLISLFNLIF